MYTSSMAISEYPVWPIFPCIVSWKPIVQKIWCDLLNPRFRTILVLLTNPLLCRGLYSTYSFSRLGAGELGGLGAGNIKCDGPPGCSNPARDKNPARDTNLSFISKTCVESQNYLFTPFTLFARLSLISVHFLYSFCYYHCCYCFCRCPCCSRCRSWYCYTLLFFLFLSKTVDFKWSKA